MAANINQEPKKEKEVKKITGKIKSSCQCVDSSESALSINKIKELLNTHYLSDSSFQQLKVNNNCDLATQKAIMRFQADTGAEQDGCVGDETEGKMVEVGLIKALTISPSSNYSAGISQDSDLSDISLPAPSSGGTSSGDTIVIKANVFGPSPHSGVVPQGTNYHGYGRNSSKYDVEKGKKGAKSGYTEDDAYFVDGINVGDFLRGKPGIGVGSGKSQKQWGTKLLAVTLAAAAAAANVVGQKLGRTSGETLLADVSLGRCYNKQERKKTLVYHVLWVVGGQKYLQSVGVTNLVSKQILTFYKTKGTSAYYNPVKSNFQGFDYARNCEFLRSLLMHPEMEAVLIGSKVVKAMQAWVKKQSSEIQNRYKIILSSSKIGYDRKTGHDDSLSC